jgi:hypothetical protein
MIQNTKITVKMQIRTFPYTNATLHVDQHRKKRNNDS